MELPGRARCLAGSRQVNLALFLHSPVHCHFLAGRGDPKRVLDCEERVQCGSADSDHGAVELMLRVCGWRGRPLYAPPSSSSPLAWSASSTAPAASKPKDHFHSHPASLESKREAIVCHV
jgi:hypothetical protein